MIALNEMKHNLSFMVLLFGIGLMIGGCGDDIDDTPAQFVRAVNDNELWEVYFDKLPEALSVDGAKEYALSGSTLRITGESCKTDIVVLWQGGQKTFNYSCGRGEISRPPPNKITAGGTEGDGPPPAKRVVTIEPPPGATVPPMQEFTLELDEGVKWCDVNGARAEGSGQDWKVVPELKEGAVNLNVTWVNRDGSGGSQLVGPYIVKNPD